MFKLNPDPTFPCTVQITRPGRDSKPLALVFKHKKASELTSFLRTANGRTDMDMLKEMVDSIDPAEKAEGVSDEDFLLELGENYPTARSDLLNTYLRELTESRVKN
jgi:hypothetical protein